MPGWHEQTAQWVADGKLAVVGVVQEQHAERTRLYKQWRQLSWPLAQDALNLLDVKAVPLAIAIDEEGKVVSHRATPRFLNQWLEGGSSPAPPPTQQWVAPSEENGLVSDGDDDLLWHAETRLSQAIEKYGKALDEKPRADVYFRRAVAYRMRFDQLGDPEDFQAAVDHWSRALDLDPNHYIYRRRIQQYGARLSKPYPFYDWVDQALQEIAARGETPVKLSAPLSGAEIAANSREFRVSETGDNPDPNARINLDADDLVQAHVVVVPGSVRPGEAARVHVILNPGANGKWNNESDPTQLWVAGVAGVEISDRLMEAPLPQQVETAETRRFEFEVRIAPGSTAPLVNLPGFVLFSVCRNDDGQCLFLRQNLEIKIQVAN